MAKVVAYFTRRTNQLVAFSKPRLATALRYSAAELGPPGLKDLGQVPAGINQLVSSYRTGAYRNLTVKEAWRNTLVGVEIVFWFFAGECIGKRGIVGYDIPGATNWDIHF